MSEIKQQDGGREMKYEENVWYGWNGGECPVHPETVVEVQTYGKNSGSNEDLAYTFSWNGPDFNGNRIIAFRVIKEHREPREFWLCDGVVFANREAAETWGASGEIIHVKEVLE